MSVEAADYGFEEREGNGSTTFEIVPPRLGCAGNFSVLFGAFATALMFGTPIGALIGYVLTASIDGSGAGAGALVGFVGTLILFTTQMRRGLYGSALKRRVVIVSRDGIHIDGKLYARKHIGEFWIEAPRGIRQPISGSSTLIGGTGIAGGMLAVAGVGMNAAEQAGAAIGRASSAAVNKRSYSLMMKYGSKPTYIAPMLLKGVAETLGDRVVEAFFRFGS